MAELTDKVTTVIFHSALWPYLSASERRAITDLLDEKGRQCGTDAPLAWLRLEDRERGVEVRCRLWPAGEDKLLAEAHAHGQWGRWPEAGDP